MRGFLLKSPLRVSFVLGGTSLFLCPLAAQEPMAQEPAEAVAVPQAAPSPDEEKEFWVWQEVLDESQRRQWEREAQIFRHATKADKAGAALETLRSQRVPGTRWSECELRDPRRAVEFYGQWLTQTKHEGTPAQALGVRVASLSALLAAREVSEPRWALEILDWSIALFARESSHIRLQLQRDSLIREQRGELKTPQTITAQTLTPLPEAVRVGEMKALRLAPSSVAPLPVTPLNSAGVAPLSVAGVVLPATASIRGASSASPVTIGAFPASRATIANAPLANAPLANAPLASAPLASAPLSGVRPSLELPLHGAARGTSVEKANLSFSSLPSRSVMHGDKAQNIASNAQGLRFEAALEAIQADKQTPQTTWQSGALSFESVVAFIESSNEWIVGAEKERPGLHEKLIALLLEKAPEKIANWKSLSPQMRLWLADFFQNRRDERAVEVAESILAEFKTPVKGENPLLFQAIERIGWFYRDTHQWEKSAQAWLKMQDLHADTGWWTGDSFLIAARAYDQLGQRDKANQLREKIPALGHGFLNALTRYDEVAPLIQAGQLAQASALLSQPLHITDGRLDGVIAQNAWLAQLALEQGDAGEALRYASLALEAGAKIPPQELPVKNLHDLAREVYLQSGGWKTQPLQADVQQLSFLVNASQPTKPQIQRFRLRTYDAETVEARVDNPAFRVRVLPLQNWAAEPPLESSRDVEVIVEFSAPKADIPKHTQKQNYTLALHSATRNIKILIFINAR